MDDLLKKLSEMAEDKVISRKALKALISEIKKERHSLGSQISELHKEVKAYMKSLEEQEAEIEDFNEKLGTNNILEEQLFEEFFKRVQDARNAKLKLNDILKDFEVC